MNSVEPAPGVLRPSTRAGAFTLCTHGQGIDVPFVFWEKTTDERIPPESLAGVKMPNGKEKSTARNSDEMLKYSETNTGRPYCPCLVNP
nr:MAG TPA: hypothetical protein [Caudoviricetes sp.]